MDFDDFCRMLLNRRKLNGMSNADIARDLKLGNDHARQMVVNIIDILDLPVPTSNGESIPPVSGEIDWR
jgi:hypothetical protein